MIDREFYVQAAEKMVKESRILIAAGLIAAVVGLGFAVWFFLALVWAQSVRAALLPGILMVIAVHLSTYWHGRSRKLLNEAQRTLDRLRALQ